MSLTILVVDDSAPDRLIIRKMLSEHTVLVARDGLEAMDQIEAHDELDLMILDLNMPVMDGFQVLERLRSNARYQKLRTIILTNYDELDNEIRGLKLGAVDYIRKPIQMESLKTRIEIHAELLRIQQSLELRLLEQGLTFDTIFTQAPVGIALSYNDGPLEPEQNRFFRINPMFETITGRSQEDLKKLGWVRITHPDDLEEDLINFRKLQAGELSCYSMEKRYIKPDDSIVWVQMVVAPLTSSDGRQYSHICLIEDITQRKAAQAGLLESERSKAVLLSHLPGMAYRCLHDWNWTMEFVSDGCKELLGYPPGSLLLNKALCFGDVIAPEYRQPLWNEWARVLKNRLPFRYEYQIITAKGERKWVLELGQGIFGENGEVEALEGILLDISDRKEIEDDLRYHYEHDRWTGLYNHSYLEALLSRDAKRKDARSRALVCVNLSEVQSVTAAYGFHYTLELIKKTAEALSAHSTNSRPLCVIYENRFVFYLSEVADRETLRAFCERVACSLEALLSSERVGGGIGVVEIEPEQDHDVDRLLKRLLITSEEAIERSGGDYGICFYDMEFEMRINREEEIKRVLTRAAYEEDDCTLSVMFQPILDLNTNRICSFEALARLSSDTLGKLSPLEFIPIAEKTKLIIPIGNKVLLQALDFLNTLNQTGYGQLSVFINVSVIQLLREDFCESLLAAISEKGVSPNTIGLELTESVFSINYQDINRILGGLQAQGLHIAIDDFGTGYSSLARERDLNINSLKIDKSFIDKLMFLRPGEAITGDIISMAHKLGHTVTAEGVEHEKQQQYLLGCGCDQMQGYLISKPLEPEAALDFLHGFMCQA
jgi:PAS domain S-box-containing protein